MNYDTDTYHRRSIRLKSYDYTGPGAYFVTICTQNRACFFGAVADEEMQLNNAGEITKAAWAELPARFPSVRLDVFIVMPNHAHLLVAFPDPDALKTQCDSWTHYTGWQINQALGQSGKFWQQEPFDHLVRSPKQYEYLRHYIADNPKKANLHPGEYHYRRYPK